MDKDRTYIDSGLPLLSYDEYKRPSVIAQADFNQAVVNLELAGAKGDGHAYALLGQLWLAGSVYFNDDLHDEAYKSIREEGIPLHVPELQAKEALDPSYKIAFENLSRAVEINRDEVWAINTIAGYYRIGVWVVKDEKRSVELYQESLERGRRLLSEGKYTIQCDSRGLFTKESALTALLEICCNYSYMLFEGRGCEARPEEARRVFNDFLSIIDCRLKRRPSSRIRSMMCHLGIVQ